MSSHGVCPCGMYLNKDINDGHIYCVRCGEYSIVEFKSIPIYYNKEKSGIKPNTVREEHELDERFALLRKEPHPQWIKIINRDTEEFFHRRITDVTIWNRLFIISWKHEEGK